MSDRSYTKEQEVIVERILKHGHTEYYKILEVDKSATENEIKKAYRKISLKVHPDKNGHPKADESFKRVNKAFEVLGDQQKRTIFDQTGGEAPSGFGSSGGHRGGSPFGQGVPPEFFAQGFPQGFQQGFQTFNFGDDDIFSMLFGQGGTQGFSFGGPGGFRMYTSGPQGFGAQRPRTRQHGRQQQQQGPPPDLSFVGQLKQYLPLILMLLIPLLSNLFSETPEKFQMRPTPKFSHERISERFAVPYYITPDQASSLSSKKLKELDVRVENNYVGILRDECQKERNYKDMKIQNAYGWFLPDKEKLAEAQSMRLPYCEKLADLGQNFL
jgi:DnaJ family protein B protein 12